MPWEAARFSSSPENGWTYPLATRRGTHVQRLQFHQFWDDDTETQHVEKYGRQDKGKTSFSTL